MQITRPNAKTPTAEELQSIEKLRALVARAAADGKISKAEIDAINTQIHADHKVTYGELEILRDLVLAKLQTGELEWEWD